MLVRERVVADAIGHVIFLIRMAEIFNNNRVISTYIEIVIIREPWSQIITLCRTGGKSRGILVWVILCKMDTVVVKRKFTESLHTTVTGNILQKHYIKSNWFMHVIKMKIHWGW